MLDRVDDGLPDKTVVIAGFIKIADAMLGLGIMQLYFKPKKNVNPEKYFIA